jgi:hypothetical protein
MLSSFVCGAGADGQSVMIAAGAPGGSYRDLYAANLERLLAGHEVEIKSTSGSGENLELLADGKVDLAFAQTDVYADFLLGDTARYASVQVLGRVAAECVYIATRKAGAIAKFAQLGNTIDDRSARIALGPATSGMRGTWRYMSHLQPALKRAQIFDDGGVLALNRLALGGYDAVGWVTDPENRDHSMLQAVMANDDLELLGVDDPSLSGALPNGVKVYEPRTLKLRNGWFAPRMKTICTSSLLLARAGASPELLQRVSNILSLETDELTKPRP